MQKRSDSLTYLFVIRHLFICVSASLIGFSHAALVAPVYFQDFEGYTDGETDTDFYENNNNAFVVRNDEGGDLAFVGRIAGSPNAAAWVVVPESGGKDFTLSTVARLSEASLATSGSNMFFSLVAAGTGATPDAASTWGYRLNVSMNTGVVTLTKNATGVTFTSTTGSNILSNTIGTLYNLTLSATYTSATSALVTVTASDGTNTFSGTYTDNAAPSGTHFGYRLQRNNTATGDGAIGVYFDDFSLQTVPEPTSAVMIGMIGAGMLGIRRKRAQR